MPTVLIVDDTAVDRRLAGGLLENAPNVEVCYANDGREALTRIGSELPDLVLTDLQMPEVDGLELVNEIQDKYPDLPVVLMTAHGSENIAAQALASGAASFVPKNDLAESLVETVMHILALSQSDYRYKKLVSCTTKTDFEFSLENDGSIIEPLIDMIQQVIMSQEVLSHRCQVQVGVALEHALTNAMFRGNLEINRVEYPVLPKELIAQRNQESPFQDRRVYFRALVTPEKVSFTVRDQGLGFDPALIPEVCDPESFKDGIGRGLVLIKAFMDEVEFADEGRTVEMTKLRSSAPSQPR
jgi:CheY-like chemotaxis protein